MASTETKVQTAAQLFEQVRSYLMLERKYYTIEASERITRLFSALLLTLILLGVGMLVIALALFTLVHLLADMTGQLTLSYALVTLFTLLLVALIWFCRNALIVRPISRFIDSVLNSNDAAESEGTTADVADLTPVEPLPENKNELRLTIKLREKEIKESFNQLTSSDAPDDPTVGERVGSMIDKGMAVYRGATFALGLYNFFKFKKSKSNNTKAPLIALLMLLSSMVSCAQQPTTFMVISDLHVLPTTLYDDTLSLERDPKLAAHSQELFDSAMLRVESLYPDFLLIPGDLSYNGELEAHSYVSQRLNALVDAGTKVYVIPGNHDIDNPTAKALFANPTDETPSAHFTTSDDFTSLYARCGYADAVMRDESTLSYLAYPADGLALLCLDSTRPNNNVARYSNGGLTLSLLDWVDQATALAKSENRRILAMMHHPVMEHFDHQTEVASNYVSNSDTDLFPELEEVQQRLMDAGVTVMFTGHFHIHSIQHVTDLAGHELHDVSTGALSAYASPLRTGSIDSEGVLTLSTDYITEYHQLCKQHNDVFAETVLDGMAKQLFPKFDKVKEAIPAMFQSMVRLPETSDELAQDLRSYLYAPILDIYHALVYGDEDQYNPDQLYQAYQDSLDAYMNYVCKDNSLLVSLMKETLVNGDSETAAYFNQSDEIIRSILYNYVGDTNNWVPDCNITLTLPHPGQSDPDAITSISSDNNRPTRRYTLDGKPVKAEHPSQLVLISKN